MDSIQYSSENVVLEELDKSCLSLDWDLWLLISDFGILVNLSTVRVIVETLEEKCTPAGEVFSWENLRSRRRKQKSPFVLHLISFVSKRNHLDFKEISFVTVISTFTLYILIAINLNFKISNFRCDGILSLFSVWVYFVLVLCRQLVSFVSISYSSSLFDYGLHLVFLSMIGLVCLFKLCFFPFIHLFFFYFFFFLHLFTFSLN